MPTSVVSSKLNACTRSSASNALVKSTRLQDRVNRQHAQPSKTKKATGKRIIIEWNEDGQLRGLIDEILRIKPRRIGTTYLFTTREGKCYVVNRGKCNAFDSLWQRFMKKVLTETKVSERFQERDLRATVASDSDTLVEASERLGHASTEITQRVYRRKPSRVKPLTRGSKK